MIPDPTDEIKTIRRNLAAKCDNDVTRIGADIRRQQFESGRLFIVLPKREPVLARAANAPSMRPIVDHAPIDVENHLSPPR